MNDFDPSCSPIGVGFVDVDSIDGYQLMDITGQMLQTCLVDLVGQRVRSG